MNAVNTANAEGKRLQCLIKHIKHVQEGCTLISENLISQGRFEDAKTLLQNSMIHDNSKFMSPEWDHLTSKVDPLFFDAWQHHVKVNPHHPEFHESIHVMPDVYVYEMVADWWSRSIELNGKHLSEWIDDVAMSRYDFNRYDRIYDVISEGINCILEPAFV